MAAALVPALLYSQLFVTPPVPTKDFSRQTVIVTGSNTGLGLEAARHFVRLNAEKVILGVRSLEKGKPAKKSIEESLKRHGVIEVWRLDMSSYASVKDFAKKAETLKRIDVLLLNAGVSISNYGVCEDNEATITINVVSTVLLALLLVPKLRETASTYSTIPHISIVSSELHYLAAFKEKNSNNIIPALNDNHDLAERYPVSKLLQCFFVRAIAPQINALSKPKLILNCLTPGYCYSDITRDYVPWRAAVISISRFVLGRSTEVGSRCLVHAAEAGEESHGKFLASCKIMEYSPFVKSAEGARVQEKVFAELSAMLEKIQPGIMATI